MNARVQRGLVWCTPAGFVLIFAALLAAGWFPLPSPQHSAGYVGAYYRDHTDGIRLGAVLLTAGAALLAPLAAVLTVQMKAMGAAPLAYLQLGMGSASPLAISITSFFWWTAAFRPERDPVVTQGFNDAGWLCLTAVIFLVVLQMAAIAAAILTDASGRFPRWLAYQLIWTALLLFPSLLCLWFKHGPFAWNGVASLYLAFVAVGALFVSLIVQLLRAIGADERADAQL